MFNFFSSHHTDEIDFMSPRAGAMRKMNRRFAIILSSVICGLVFAFVVWASFSEINVVTRGNGQVVPSQKTQVIAHLEGGIIKDIFVKEGDLVEAGQILLKMDPEIAFAHYKANREQYLRLLATVYRLQAQIGGKEYQTPEMIRKESSVIAAEEMEHYLKRKQQVETQIFIAKDIVTQKKEELKEEQAKLVQIQEQLKLAEEELTMVSPLVAEQLISKREILRLKRDTASLKGELAKSKAAIPKEKATLEQAERELEQTSNRFKNEDEEQLREILIKLAETKAQMLEAYNRLHRTEIRSPLKGIVKEVKFKTIGGVIRPGEEIMNIVPYEDNLLVEANVLPSEVAFIHPNQEANVKVTAYDYSIYGSLKAQLIKISADTVHDPEQKKEFYKILLRTNKNYLEYKGKKLPIIPGMTIEVDILTGKRTIMTYLLKPLIRGFTESFRER